MCGRKWGVINSFGGVARGSRWRLSGRGIGLFPVFPSSRRGQTSPPSPRPIPKAPPHLTRVTSQPTLVTEEINLSVSVWGPSEPSPPPPPSSSPLNHLAPAAETWCVSALMKTLGGEAISHSIPSNTLDMFQHLEMEHRLVLFGVWLHLCCGNLRVQSGLCALTLQAWEQFGSCVWFHIHNIL